MQVATAPIPDHTEKAVAENDIAPIPTISDVPPETKIADSRVPCAKCGLLVSPDYSCPKCGVKNPKKNLVFHR